MITAPITLVTATTASRNRERSSRTPTQLEFLTLIEDPEPQMEIHQRLALPRRRKKRVDSWSYLVEL